LRCNQANGENTARSARAPLKNGAAVRGSRLKIATDVAGMLGSSEAPAKTGRSFSLARMEIDKNVVAAALALAKKCGTELSYAHLNQAVKISEDFIREFYGVEGNMYTK
jgi:hypothetical protein